MRQGLQCFTFFLNRMVNVGAVPEELGNPQGGQGWEGRGLRHRPGSGSIQCLPSQAGPYGLLCRFCEGREEAGLVSWWRLGHQPPLLMGSPVIIPAQSRQLSTLATCG